MTFYELTVETFHIDLLKSVYKIFNIINFSHFN